MTPIQTLTAKVEAGEWPPVTQSLRSAPKSFSDLLGFAPFDKRERLAWSAYHGSLDATISLIEAVLPGWRWSYYSEDGHCIIGPDANPKIYEEHHHKTPSRALLLCILKAMEDGE